MSEDMDTNSIPVYACARSDYSAGTNPDGYATTATQAARIIRRIIAERDGDGATGITANDVFFSRNLCAFFIEE